MIFYLVPELMAYMSLSVGSIHAERILCPGAVMSGLIASFSVGPRPENEEIWSLMSVDPTAITLLKSPGEVVTPQSSPPFPMEKTGTIPASRQPLTMGLYHESPGALPQELDTISGASLQVPTSGHVIHSLINFIKNSF